jgi:hypothetical protein
LGTRRPGLLLHGNRQGVGADIDALNALGVFTPINLTDAGAPTLRLTAAQDAGVLAAITNSNLVVNVSDSAANVAANFDALAADTRISSITLTDGGTPTLTLTAAQAQNDAATLAKISSPYALVASGGGAPVTVSYFLANHISLDASGQISIADMAANVAGGFDALNADANVTSISFTDSGTAALALTAAQTLSNTRALSKISSPYALSIVDSAANIVALTPVQIAALKRAGVSAVWATDAPVVLSIAQAVALQQSGFSIHPPASDAVSVADTAVQIAAITQAQADALNADGCVSIAATDGAVALGAAAAVILSGDGLTVLGAAVTISDAAAALAALTPGQVAALKAAGYGFAVFDTAGDLEALSPAQIAALGAEGASITATVAGVALSVAEAVAYTQASYGIQVPAGDTVSVADTAANIAADLDKLGGFTSIVISDSAPVPVPVTLGALKADAATIARLVNADGSPYQLAVADPAGNITRVSSWRSALVRSAASTCERARRAFDKASSSAGASAVRNAAATAASIGVARTCWPAGMPSLERR